jgi:glucose-6-phosphate isomerase
MDNIDPVTFAGMMRLCPPDNTLYNVISKSGDTAETVSQLMIVAEAIENTLGAEALKDHIVITTNPRSGIGSDGKPIKPSLLYPVTDAHGIKTFIVPANVGGRFSVFSPVGMFPAAMLGMDLDALRAGCAVMDRRCRTPNLMENPAYLYAAVLYVADRKKGKRISVMMPYADALRDVADWYRQLWAESLGKRWSFDGDEVFAGQTPVKSLGVTDQHSQVQLYREGPNDKIVTIVEVSCFSETAPIPESFSEIPQFAYLRGKTMNKLMAAELRGTIEALKASLRPVVRIVLPEVSAGTVAQLLYLLEVATAMAGRLYNVNAFDQPGVEEGKRIARALMAL